MHKTLKVYTDGGARGNPGPAASGIVITTLDGQVVEAFGVYLGETTNNQAEYRAVETALDKAIELGANRIEFYVDSQLIERQIKGQYRVKNPELRPIYLSIMQKMQGRDVTFTHIPRELNKLADAQVNIAIDQALAK